MVTLVKHEWHSVDSQFTYELDEDTLSEIYPDLSEDEIAEKFRQIEEGEIDVEEIVNDAWENDVELEWDRQYDDWWTDRKGGYDITYELGDESSYHHTPPPPEPTHKCTKCKWVGQSYDADWQWQDSDGKDLDEARKVCPMCDSDIELTEVGIKEEQKNQERMTRAIQVMKEEEEEPVDEAELEAALEELKREFEELMTQTIKCTECEWTGTEEDCEKEGICPNCCAYTEEIVRDDE